MIKEVYKSKQLIMPWGPISELDLPYEVRKLRYERRKRQRTLTDREREIAVKIKKGVQDENGIRVPDIKILDEHGCTVTERRKVLDFVEGGWGKKVSIYQKVRPPSFFCTWSTQ